MRRKTATILRLEGYIVVEAEGAVAGIEAATEHPPDVVLCDIMLPDGDGYAVLEALRTRPATAAIPFIFLTARGGKSDVRTGMNLGADDYLVKPVARLDLLRAVEARCERQRLNEQSLRRTLEWASPTPDFSSFSPLVSAFGLSEREAETLLWIAQGKTNAEIAMILGNREATVKKLAGQVFDKLGVSTRTAAALRAVEVLPRSVSVSPALNPART
jgi:DNA-binding NarL/FixJ family response regulator